MSIRDVRRIYKGKPEVNLATVLAKANKNIKGFCESQLWITDFYGKRVNLKFNASQLQVWDVLQQQQQEGRPLRVIVLKSRQVGISTFASGLVFARTYTKPNTNAVIMGHHKKATSNLFAKQRYFYEHLDPDLVVPLDRTNTEELYCKEMNWRISLATAGTPHATRSNTILNLLFTEAGFYDDLLGIKGATEAAVPQILESMIIIETTANGMGSDFHKLWKLAIEGQIDYCPKFLKWYEDPECALPKFPNQRIQDDILKPYFDKFPDLRERAREFKLTPEQIGWYGHKLKNQYNGDELLCQQEFPMTWEEAFLSTGRPCIPTKVVLAHVNKSKPGKLYDPTADLNRYEDLKEEPWLVRNKNTYLEIWRRPVEGRYYLISVDVAQGTDTGDFTCAHVFDIANQKVCATFHGRIDPKQAAAICAKLGKMYNNAVIAPEIDGLGYTLLSHLKDIYFNIYQQRKDEGYRVIVSNKLGWETTTESRHMIVVNMRRMLGEHTADTSIMCPDRALLDELLTFVDKDGKPQAQKGFHDDRVMAYAIGLWCCLEEIKTRPEILRVVTKVDGESVSVREVKPDEILRAVKDPNWYGQAIHKLNGLGNEGPIFPDGEAEW